MKSSHSSTSPIGTTPLREIVRRHRSGEHVGITSVCSAHPLVLQAAVEHATETGGTVLIEATSNQVDQTGGYTGLRPDDFRDSRARDRRCGRRCRAIGSSSAATTSVPTAGVPYHQTRRWSTPTSSCARTWPLGSPRSTWTAAFRAPTTRRPLTDELVAERERATDRASPSRLPARRAANALELRHRHRGARARWRARDARRRWSPTSAQARAGHATSPSRGVRGGRGGGCLAPRGGARGPAGGRVRPPAGDRLPSPGRAAS